MMVLDSIKPDDIIPSFMIFFFSFFGKIWFCNIRITFRVSVYVQSFVLKYNDITIDSKSLLSEWQHLIDTNFCKSSILRQIDFGWFFINMTKIFLFTQSWSLPMDFWIIQQRLLIRVSNLIYSQFVIFPSWNISCKTFCKKSCDFQNVHNLSS